MMTEPAVGSNGVWQSRAREADLLVASLRHSRLTVLYGEAGAGKTALLQAGVLLRLRRRREDRRPARAMVPRMDAPLPERRHAHRSLAEVPIFFDAWNGTPLTSLLERVVAALRVSRGAMVRPGPSLAESLAQWGEELGVRFLFLFDRFEEYLAAPPEQPEISTLTDELVLLLGHPSVHANFVIALHDDAEPLMDRWRARVTGLREASVRLPPLDSAAPAAQEPFERQEPAAEPDRGAAAAPAAPRKRAARHVWAAKWLTATAACAVVFFAVSPTQDVGRPGAPTHLPTETAAGMRPAPLPVTIPPAPPVSLPKMTLITDPASGTDAAIAADLARIVAADIGIELVVRSDVPFWRDDGAPRVAIVRYEELQVAGHKAQPGEDRIDALRVLMPLYTEEIYLIARRDSKLTYLHDLRDARINVGPDGSSRWLAAARLYDRMFGVPMPLENVHALDDGDALTRLVVDKSLDAMLVVAAQPSEWLAELPPEMAREIKLLKLDPEHPAGQRAIGAYLPATVRAANYGRWLAEDVPTLATMSFLITSEYTDPAAVERLDSFTRTVCRKLSDLRREGHPKWREVQPGFEVDAGLPVSASAKAIFQACLAESEADTSAVNRR